jgi:K+-sensing histidine kinase KdpD
MTHSRGIVKKAGRELKVRYLVVLALCAALACVASFFLRGQPTDSVVPLMFILVIIPIAQVFGTVAGTITAIVIGAAFSVFLFRPYGIPIIYARADWVRLILFELTSMVVALFSPGS